MGEVVADNTLFSPREATVFLCTKDQALGHAGNRDPTQQEVFEWVAEWLDIEPSTVATYWERACQKENEAHHRKRMAENTIRALDEPHDYAIELLNS